jgi:hypothetical protein
MISWDFPWENLTFLSLVNILLIMANDDGYSYWDDILGSYWENQLFVVVSYQYLAGGRALPL